MMNTVNPSTGETPNAFVFGGFADTEEDLIMPDFPGKLARSEDPQGFVRELQEEQVALFARAEEYQNMQLAKLAERAEQEGALAPGQPVGRLGVQVAVEQPVPGVQVPAQPLQHWGRVGHDLGAAIYGCLRLGAAEQAPHRLAGAPRAKVP